MLLLVICYSYCVAHLVDLAFREHEGIGGSARYELEDFAVEMN